MITVIVNFFIWAVTSLRLTFKDMVNVFIKFSTTTWGVLLIISTLAFLAFDDTIGAIQDIGSGLGFLSVGAAPSLGGTGANASFLLMVANTFTPLDELFQYGSAYLVLMAGWGIYRLIKSWLPTVGGV